MNKTILQVPISQQMKIDAEKAATAQGFSSLQEAVRIFLNKLAQGTLQVSFEETVRLSDDAIDRYNTDRTSSRKGYIKNGKRIVAVSDVACKYGEKGDASHNWLIPPEPLKEIKKLLQNKNVAQAYAIMRNTMVNYDPVLVFSTRK